MRSSPSTSWRSMRSTSLSNCAMSLSLAWSSSACESSLEPMRSFRFLIVTCMSVTFSPRTSTRWPRESVCAGDT